MNTGICLLRSGITMKHSLVAKIASAGFYSLYLPDRISAFFRDDISSTVRVVLCDLCE